MEDSTDYKFNVGDKIVELTDAFIANPYHWKSTIRIYTVGAANEKYFTTSSRLSMSGMDQCVTYKQQDGHALYGASVKYHVEKDKEKIQQIISDYIEKYDKETKKDCGEELAKLEKQLEKIQAQIANIKSDPYFTIGWTNYNVREFKNNWIDYMNKSLGYEQKEAKTL
jgi:hypothetical protein